MNEKKSLMEYPTPRACIIVFVVCLILVVTIGSILQYYIFLPGLYVTEWLLILGPPLFLLWKNKAHMKESLKLHKFSGTTMLLGIIGGIGIYSITVGLFLIMVEIIGPYPSIDFLEEAIPKTWLEFIPWILALGFSAGVCEEVLFRGFIQNGLNNYWGPMKAVIVAAVLFGVFHLDPWRTPSAVLLGLMAGYLLIRTGSLYSAILVHMTSNSFGQILSFTNKLPQDNVQWLSWVAVSLVLVFIVVVYIEMKRKGKERKE